MLMGAEGGAGLKSYDQFAGTRRVSSAAGSKKEPGISPG